MDINKYEQLSGITVTSNDTTFVTAIIARTKKKLESMLGYTLDETLVNTNEYVEIGKTLTDCPCPDSVDLDNLEAPDAVVKAYRMFSYRKGDRILSIDPATDVHKIKLVKNGVTYLTLDDSDYTLIYKNGLIRHIELCDTCFSNTLDCCECTQLAVDATWVWDDEDNIPLDLLYVWGDMVTYYADDKKDIKSETLGTHSYSKGNVVIPEVDAENIAVLKRFSGPRGSLYRMVL